VTDPDSWNGKMATHFGKDFCHAFRDIVVYDNTILVR